jgi:hypothetical protein
MAERLHIETLDEIFFPGPVRDSQGRIIPAPPAAKKMKIELSKTWLINFPKLPHEEPLVSMGPVIEEGREGYSVRKEIIYY